MLRRFYSWNMSKLRIFDSARTKNVSAKGLKVVFPNCQCKRRLRCFWTRKKEIKEFLTVRTGKKTARQSCREMSFFPDWELRVYSTMFLVSFDCSKKIFSSVEGKNTYRQEPESVWFFWLLTRICCIDCGVFRLKNKVWFFDCAQREKIQGKEPEGVYFLGERRGCVIFCLGF